MRLLAAFSLTAFAACSRCSSRAAPDAGATVTIRVSVEPTGLSRIHDRMAEATMSHYTVGPIYETLVTADSHDPERLVPSLAEKWAESEDHLRLELTLRGGVRFHDDSPLTSADVAATLAVILDEGNATTAMRSTLGEFAGVDVINDRVLVLRWKRPHFLAIRSVLLGVPIMPAHLLQGAFDTLPIHAAPVGTGPFRFEQWQRGVQLSLVRNERYRGTQAKVDRVVLRFVADEVVAAQLWEQGAFDVMTRVSTSTWRATEAASWAAGYRRTARLDNTYYWLGWNERLPVFADRRVRRALAMLYPAETVAHVVDLDLEPRTTCPYYRSTTACDPSVLPIGFDPARANTLLDEAGFTQRAADGVRVRGTSRLSFTVLTTATSVKFGKLLPLYQEQLRVAGVVFEIERIDAAAYMSRVRAHDFDVATLSWSSADDLVDLFQVFHSSQALHGSNYVGYSNAEVDARLEQILTTFEPEQRAMLEREVHRLIFDDQPYLFLTLRPQLDAVKTRVRSAPWRSGWYDLSQLELE